MVLCPVLQEMPGFRNLPGQGVIGDYKKGPHAATKTAGGTPTKKR